jgi:hypothetical protein
VILALAAALAIVVQDHAHLRAAPSASAAELTQLWQGDVLEVRGARADYLNVYDYRRERGGYVRSESVRAVGLTEAAAPELLAVMRFLEDGAGSEALGISYGAAYLKAAPPRQLTAEPFEAIAMMAERLADQASASTSQLHDVAAHLEVIEQFGVHVRSFERNGRIQVCYDGELFRRVLALSDASAEQRARAALGLTRPDCIDPSLGPQQRATLDEDRGKLLDGIREQELSAITMSRVHARRAAVWASIAFARARHGQSPGEAAQRALIELLGVHPEDLGENHRTESVDAAVRVSAIRWAVALPTVQVGPLQLRATTGQPGQTCVALAGPRGVEPLVRRCTYGIVWLTSVQAAAQGRAIVLAVQPLESWRELWVFHESGGTWTVDVLSPGLEDPEEGYVDFAGFAPRTNRLLIAREVKERGHFHRYFEELRLTDLAVVRHASSPELLPDFGRWQDAAWRRDTLALH